MEDEVEEVDRRNAEELRRGSARLRGRTQSRSRRLRRTLSVAVVLDRRLLRPNPLEEERETRGTRTRRRAASSGRSAAWTRKPATDGPTTKDSDRLRLILLLASTTSRRGTTATKSVDQLTSNMTANVPTANATRVELRKAEDVERVRRSAPTRAVATRPMSATIISRRRAATRSIQTPASSEKKRCGSSSAATRKPICAAEASSVRTATSGSASSVTWSPSCEIDCAAQSFRNSGWRRSGGGSGSAAAAGVSSARLTRA